MRKWVEKTLELAVLAHFGLSFRNENVYLCNYLCRA